MLNLSRETITRVFQQLQRKNIVTREGPKKLIIKKPEDLEKIAHSELTKNKRKG